MMKHLPLRWWAHAAATSATASTVSSVGAQSGIDLGGLSGKQPGPESGTMEGRKVGPPMSVSADSQC
eukprot:1156647-Pelagomonas_calceolata.AAC.20